MKKILGISAFYHDSAAALVVGGRIIAAAQEERFTRKKHTPDFPIQAIKFCLLEGEVTLEEIDAIVFYDKPLLKFERLLETYYAFSPKGLPSFLKAIPVWLKEKLFLKKLIYDGLKKVESYNRKKIKLLFTEHHLSHAASAFYPSPYKKAAILTIDGVGEWSTASIAIGNNKTIEILKEMHFPHSVGLLYSSFTYYLGFKVNSGEYKLMGLAPYGIPNSKQVKEFIELIKTHLVKIKADGSIWLNQSYFNYASGLRMTKNSKWEKLFKLKRRKEESDVSQAHCNLAMAIQVVTEEIVLKMAKEAKRVTNCDYLCMAGGVALNCVANGKLIEAGIFKEVYIQPAAGDSGGALGAAVATSHIYFGEDRINDLVFDGMSGSYLGPEFSDNEIEQTIEKFDAKYELVSDFTDLCRKISGKLIQGEIVGWFQGKMEFGPRALGNRSILGDPSFPEMQKRLNLKIKQREGFRPFAPSVLEEEAAKYFKLNQASPYMLMTSQIADSIKVELPSDYYEMPLKKRLDQKRSELQAVTHLDFSARIQTVNKSTNPRYWSLLSSMKEKTGKGVLVNTSFNVRGEPIVYSPTDAYLCFMNTEMDYLVINNHIFTKEKQVDWQDREKWSKRFKKD